MPKSFYSFSKLYSYNGSYNFAVGGRGVGKTFGGKKKTITDSLKANIVTIANERHSTNQFIYLRRYKEEIQLAKATFFADIHHLFPDFDFKQQSYYAMASHISERDTKKRPWFIIGYFIELSRAQMYKGVQFPNVKTIIYDEFIVEKGMTRYLPNESIAFDNFYNTVDRYKDKTRVLFLANSVSIDNPYFIEYEIDPNKADKNGFIRKSPKDSGGYFLVVHFIDSEEFQNEVYQTEFGRFIQGTEYAKYAVENEFADNNDKLIGEKDYRARYMFTLETAKMTFSVWYNVFKDEYFIQRKRPKGDEVMFTMVETQMDSEKVLMTFADKPLGALRTAFRHGRVVFKDAGTKSAFMLIFKR